MYLQHFGLKHEVLGKKHTLVLKQSAELEKQLMRILETKGIGVIIGPSGSGKTIALKQWASSLNQLNHKIIYQSDNHFKSFDIYRQFNDSLGLERSHRYSQQWRTIKEGLLDLVENKQTTPVWILDEAHHLPPDFLLHLPSFLNFNFDSKNMVIIILCGQPSIMNLFKKSAYDSVSSRIQFITEWRELDDPVEFSKILEEAFKQSGKHEKVMSESGVRIIHHASKGRLRYANRIITRALQLAAESNINHLPDNVIENAIMQFQLN